MEKLKTILKEKRISQKEFAERIGITPAALNNYVMKKTEPKIELIIKIADELNITVDYLLGKEKKTSIETSPEKSILLKTIDSLTEIECHKLNVFAQGLIMNRVAEQKQRTNNLISIINEED